MVLTKKMNKRAAGLILGIPVAAIFSFILWFFIIGPAMGDALAEALEGLGEDSFCPEDFATNEYKVCFNAEGDVIMDGLLDDSLKITIEGTSDVCHIQTGNYDFEYTGCKLDKFKSMTSYNLVVISKTGKVSLKSSVIAKEIMAGSGIVKVLPKGVKWLKRLGYFIRFI